VRSLPLSPVRTILFDVGGTILRVRPSVGEVYSRAARDHGFSVDPGVLQDRFKLAWKQGLERSRRRSHACSDEILRREWFEIVRQTFVPDVPAERLPELFEDLYEQFVSPSAWTLVDGARETFHLLRSEGLSLGILSNWDRRLESTLERLGLRAFFDFLVISHEVGYEKPHPRIFQEAIGRAGEESSRILHVGDSWEFDILPARRLGMATLWIAPAAERRARADAGWGTESFADLSREEWSALLAQDRVLDRAPSP
jgi:REG-2-like HAD superfamily hydrolase